ncbi:MAG: ABC transporter ATP-binding protein [Anaerolineae bacterium]
MSSWFADLRRGLTRTLPHDRMTPGAPSASTRAQLANLRPFLARHWRLGAVGAGIVLLNALVGFPDPLIYRFLVDQVILAQQLSLLPVAIFLLLVFQLLGMGLGALEQYFFGRLEQRVLFDIQRDLLDRTLQAPKSFFDDQETGYLMSRLLSDVQGLKFFFSSTMVYIVSQTFKLVGGVALLIYLEWRLALVTLVLLPGLVLCVRYFAGKLHILSHRSMEQQAHVSRSVEESLAATPLIKAFSTEKRTLDRLLDQLQHARQLALEQMTVTSAALLIVNSLPALARAMVLVAGAIWVIRGEWTLGSLLAFESYLGYVYGPALGLASANLQLQNALAALERVSALFDIVPEAQLGVGKKVARLAGAIEFREVSFAYDRREPVIEDLSFRIEPGEHVAIVGPSGVGKTTLLSLLLRLYRPTAGEIWFDGVAAPEYDLTALRRRIGYVPQNTLLLAGTIMENLRYGNPEASDAAVMEAAHAAGIHDFVLSLPQGYESLVGERGVNLSEGQKQRLSIARALAKEPDILVLDEPTSALDSLVEHSILQVLPALVRDRTLFIVAHRLSTIQMADRILLLNDRRLVAIGTHAELLATNEFYRALVARQEFGAPAEMLSETLPR